MFKIISFNYLQQIYREVREFHYTKGFQDQFCPPRPILSTKINFVHQDQFCPPRPILSTKTNFVVKIGWGNLSI